jgi:secreted trypsin-like serine protease
MHTRSFPSRVCLGILAMLCSAAPALAITFGVPDGNEHPNVGAVVFFENGEIVALCSGTLISPTVVLTAAHCTTIADQNPNIEVAVTFDPVLSPEAEFFEPRDVVTHDEFPGPASDPHDIAVLVFDEPILGITPAQLPTLGFLDAQNLTGQTFTAVGYGVQQREHEPGEGMPQFGEAGIRMMSRPSFQALTETWLRLSQNPATGDSGTCFGDSGGPNFFGGPDSNLIVSITITGDAVCRATNVTYRLDTASAREFLDDFVTLP